MMLCALILAGGVGSRFWPQSTDERPKQFLNLLGNETMIQMTYDRMKKIVPEDRIFIVTNMCYVKILKEQIPNIKDANIICEPYFKNTAPCILLSSFYIQKIFPNAIVSCVSSDSYIGKDDEFIKKIKDANDYIQKNNKAIVTIGITPTRPETSYGYIKCEKNSSYPYKTTKFIEKPNINLAKKYLESKEYFWNAGMYIYNNENILEEFKTNLPVEYQLLKALPNTDDKNYLDLLKTNYSKCQTISIANAVMEMSNNIYVIPSNIAWDDVGSWEALERYTKEDDKGNIIKGDAKIIDSYNNVIYGNGKKIVLLNANDLFCIDSDETIIIGRKEDLKKVHTLKDKIEDDT